jgi:hypothetical protein
MPAPRTIVLSAAAVAVLGLGGLAAASALDDPEASVDAVDVSDAASRRSASATDGSASNQQVPGLDELSGTVELDRTDDGSDDDPTDDPADDVADDLEINGVDLDFGPDDYVATADAAADFDGDGTTTTLREELAGLVGQDVTLLVRFDDDGDDADVYAIGDTTYREVSAPAPWQPTDAPDEDALRYAAAAAVGEGAEVLELDAEDDGDVAWEAKVRASDGTDHEVDLDADGKVIAVRGDD